MTCSKPEFSRTMVLSAAMGLQDNSADNLNQLCHFLEAFQLTGQAWCICSDVLWEQDQHDVSVLLQFGTILRHKIRDQLNTLTDEKRLQLRVTLMGQLKLAASSSRPGYDAVVRLLALIIADLILRMPNRETMITDCIPMLWLYAPSALVLVVQLVAEQSMQDENALQQKVLFNQGPQVIELLTNFQNRSDVNLISMWRSCLLAYGSWAYGGFLPITGILYHPIVEQAITLISRPETLERRLFGDACQCLMGLITYTTRLSFTTDMDLMNALRVHMYTMLSGLNYNLRGLSTKEKHECTQLINRLTHVFSNINVGPDCIALLHMAPRLFELQLQVVEHCKMRTVLTSVNQWLQLAEALQTRFELELYYIYQPLVKKFFVNIFPMCRLPESGPQEDATEHWDNLMILRSQVTDLLLKFADLLDLRLFLMELLGIARHPNASDSDIDLTLLFVQPLAKVLHEQCPDLLDEFLSALPTLQHQVRIYSNSLISCLAKCLVQKDEPQLSLSLVENLYYIAANQEKLRPAVTQAYDLLVTKYKELGNYKHLFNEYRHDISID